MKYVKKAGYIVATIFFLVFTLGPFVWTFVMAIYTESRNVLKCS